MPQWSSIITVGALGVSLSLPVVVPNVIVPAYNKITKGDYKVIEQWMPSIQNHAARYGVDPIFVAAVMYSESSGKPNAVSPQNAIGLMQVMPATARAECGVYTPTQLFHPEMNISCGTKYIATLLHKHARGDYRYAAAMYIGGPRFNLSATDAHGTSPLEYADRIMQHYQAISQKFSDSDG